MRPKELRVVITFETTTSAMAMEKACKEEGASGRLIPVPRQITSGCGLAWSAKPDKKEHLIRIMKAHNLMYHKLYKIEL